MIAVRPASLVAAFYGSIAIALLATHAWDPLLFATVGPQWQRHDPELRKQADGSIFFAFASDPAEAVAGHERFRAARILYPVVARGLALGHADLVGWSLLLVNLAALVLGTEVLHGLLARRGLPIWMALGYGAWGGLGLALLHDTAEPLAYLCALAGIAAQERRWPLLVAAAFLGALLTRETTVLLVGPYLIGRREGRGLRSWIVPVVVLIAWGGWLAVVALAGRGPWVPGDGFRLAPLTGYLATRPLDLPATILYLVIPALVLSVWAARELRRQPADAALWAVLLNALLVVWFPPPTAALLWHSGRVATGLIVAVLLAPRLAASAPRVWRGMVLVFASSASWTVAVVIRYLFWDVVRW